jgi:hypothetical protein
MNDAARQDEKGYRLVSDLDPDRVYHYHDFDSLLRHIDEIRCGANEVANYVEVTGRISDGEMADVYNAAAGRNSDEEAWLWALQEMGIDIPIDSPLETLVVNGVPCAPLVAVNINGQTGALCMREGGGFAFVPLTHPGENILEFTTENSWSGDGTTYSLYSPSENTYACTVRRKWESGGSDLYIIENCSSRSAAIVDLLSVCEESAIMCCDRPAFDLVVTLVMSIYLPKVTGCVLDVTELFEMEDENTTDEIRIDECRLVDDDVRAIRMAFSGIVEYDQAVGPEGMIGMQLSDDISDI